MGGPLTPKDRAVFVARRRIQYKYAKPYIDGEPDTDEELVREMKRILQDELTPEERGKLREDMQLEERMIRQYYDDMDLDGED